MKLILYSKPGCHLCEGLQEKLEQIYSIDLELEVRDITTREDWLLAYQYEVPVLVLVRSQELGVGSQELGGQRDLGSPDQAVGAAGQSLLVPLPRPSPRATVRQLEQMLQKYLEGDRRE